MNGLHHPQIVLTLAACVIFVSGCAGGSGNSGQMQSYPSPSIESGWIRNGEPIVYDNKEWFPKDDTEHLLDTEVYQIGEYKEVQIFVEKIDAKPYDRIYTKYAPGKFRYFERKDD